MKLHHMIMIISLLLLLGITINAQTDTLNSIDIIKKCRQNEDSTFSNCRYYSKTRPDVRFTGYIRDYYDLKNKRNIMCVLELQNGFFDGKQIFFFENGQMSEYYYLKIHPDDIDTIPQKEGRYMSWFPNGTIYSSGYYHHGKMVGWWYFYSEGGELIRKEKYRNNKIVRAKQK